MSLPKFFLALSLSLIGFNSISMASEESRSGGYDSEMKPFSCPKIEDEEERLSAVVALIEKQKNCWGAANVYNACQFGNTYTRVDMTASLVQICEKSIASDRSVRQIYKETQKKCSIDDQSRTAIAISNQCSRDTAILFGFIVETVKTAGQ